MNRLEWIQFLHRYRVQNPTKYASKYGNREPEEVPQPGEAAPFSTGSVTVEVATQAPPDQEVEFQAEPAPEEPKPKKTIKKKATPNA